MGGKLRNAYYSQVASFAGFENMLKGRVISADRGLLSIKSGTATINASGEAESGDTV